MTGDERARCEAVLKGLAEAARGWEFELAWKLCWLEKGMVRAGWKRAGMGLSVRVSQDGRSGLWTAVGDDGKRRVSETADTADEATALVQEAFGLKAWRPQPPPPPGWQRFSLVHSPAGEFPGFDDRRYDAIKACPPTGCVVEDFGGCFGLRCERPGARLLDAVAPLCGEIRAGYGLLMTGLGIEKLWEWSQDGPDGWGAEIVGQLLLMAAERGPKLGYDVEDLVAYLRTAAGGCGA
ncbi:hypothetical protein GCM10010347_57630 [Streptomyces cirratus]|uniref:Uncharacterized protein n=1 Tax=Streptomyces cirratus TaxID=68187 RepID=A0ABQ3F0H4_9ACTN|nr:hypothetical protein [Streptomyces cirratus]GHB79632.1 hypothetical protein GCM10010347_57630 [Streptomyces cirratus]